MAPTASPAFAGTLPDTAWADFGRRHWEREAGVLPDALPGPLIAPEKMLEALVRASELYRAGGSGVQFVFFLDGKPAERFADWLPRAGDPSIEGYVRRVERETGGEFTLLFANPHLYDGEIWQSARLLLRGLFCQVGIACGGVDTGIFLGRYSKTPFGVHRGQMSVMTFPTLGSKRFRLWRRGYGEAHPDLVDSLYYDAHLEASFELEARPVDILYWPADVWHIAEGSDEPTAAFNIGFWWDRPPMVRTLLALSEQLAAAVGEEDPRALTFPLAPGLGRGRAAPAPPVGEALRALRQVATGPDLERALAREWLTLVSADGFREVPPAAPEGALAAAPGEAAAATAPILWCPAGDGEIDLAVNGHAFTFPDTAALRAALERLTAGEALGAGEPADEVGDLLAALGEAGALAATPQEVSRS
jgi:50S ribosomal protein L16 3-hydroxylase